MTKHRDGGDSSERLGLGRGLPRRTRLVFLAFLCGFALLALFLEPPVPLGAHYHDFADKRTLLGIRNCWDVLSNIPFMIAGALGLLWLFSAAAKRAFLESRERVPYVVFFLGVLLTGFGSYWYHLRPDNSRLPWDLLPMTCSFLSLVVAQIMERISLRLAFALYAPLLLAGLASVGYWYLTEAAGHGDYRFYLFVQFFSPVVLAAVIALFPPRYTGLRYLVEAFGMFVAAKLLETFDFQVFAATRQVSGHALKHIIAGIACYWILRMLQMRRPVVPAQDDARRNSQTTQQTLSA